MLRRLDCISVWMCAACAGNGVRLSLANQVMLDNDIYRCMRARTANTVLPTTCTVWIVI